MYKTFLAIAAICCVGLISFTNANAQQSTNDSKPGIVRVFVLAGQSNMVGHGVVDLDDPKDYNGGKGTLEQVMNLPENVEGMKHLKASDGSWAVRDDVFVYYQVGERVKFSGLSIGFTRRQGEPHHFGPELQLGHILGDAFEEPVLLIKTAWGGKSLQKDFRPPSSATDGEKAGDFYTKMCAEIDSALKKAASLPEFANRKLEVSGFVWQQGWNDMVNVEATTEYATNLKNLISDVRLHFGIDDLPFVYGELGNGGEPRNEKMTRFREAQASVGKMELPNVSYVPTASFARDAKDSPNVTHLHHWFGNAESYFLVGDALGRAMVDLIEPPKPRVLILGDSISIGYTSFVRQMLKDEAVVFRPMKKQKPENCCGTDYGIKQVDRWLEIDGGNWDVIHVNFGLHDLKHVDAKTGRNSNKAEDPLQSDPEQYESQLREIVGKIKATGATVIVCTTTPVPPGCKPLRETDAPEIYNRIARKIAAENGFAVNDLFEFANGKLDEIQLPANVHFSRKGSKVLAGEVVKVIRSCLAKSKVQTRSASE